MGDIVKFPRHDRTKRKGEARRLHRSYDTRISASGCCLTQGRNDFSPRPSLCVTHKRSSGLLEPVPMPYVKGMSQQDIEQASLAAMRVEGTRRGASRSSRDSHRKAAESRSCSLCFLTLPKSGAPRNIAMFRRFFAPLKMTTRAAYFLPPLDFHTRSRKLRRSFFPLGVRMDSGWNWTP